MKKQWFVFLASVACLLVFAAVGIYCFLPGNFVGYMPKSTKAFRYSVQLGADEKSPHVLVVLDESKGTGTGYDIAVADLNGNGRLDDEKPIPAKITREDYAFLLVEMNVPSSNPETSENKYGLAFNVFVRPKAASESFSWFNPFLWKTSKLSCTPEKEISAYVNGGPTFQKDGKVYDYCFDGKPTPSPQDSGLQCVTFGTSVTLEASAYEGASGPGMREGKMADGSTTLTFCANLTDAKEQRLFSVTQAKKTMTPHLIVHSPSG
ncbi:TPA: hypothetical protein DDW35_13535, partial [Candidatus Sumerlaeota bacterium]|nr:hypothetical protein [Candidatus Sumerlaeota bacterium]